MSEDYDADGYPLIDATTLAFRLAENYPHYVDWSNVSERGRAPTSQYFEETVFQPLTAGLREIAKERPANPLEWLGKFLIAQSEETESKPPASS